MCLNVYPTLNLKINPPSPKKLKSLPSLALVLLELYNHFVMSYKHSNFLNIATFKVPFLMICLAALRQRGINLRTLLRARDHVTNLTTCSFIISRDNSTLLSSPISRSHDTTTTAAVTIPALIASHCLSTATTGIYLVLDNCMSLGI